MGCGISKACQVERTLLKEEKKAFQCEKLHFYQLQEESANKHQQQIVLFLKEVQDFREVYKNFIEIKDTYMTYIENEHNPENFETLKYMYFRFCDSVMSQQKEGTYI